MNSRKADISAWFLLSVVASMILLSAFHFHCDEQPVIDCEQCVEHIHHSGHITMAASSVDDCVLCRFLHTSMIVMAVMALTFTVIVHITAVEPAQRILARFNGVVSMRAPPVS